MDIELIMGWILSLISIAVAAYQWLKKNQGYAQGDIILRALKIVGGAVSTVSPDSAKTNAERVTEVISALEAGWKDAAVANPQMELLEGQLQKEVGQLDKAKKESGA